MSRSPSNSLNPEIHMKNSNLILIITLLLSSTLFAQNDFSKEQAFNRGLSPIPYRGLDKLRKDNPYIVIRNISNSTNGTQHNREKYVSLPHFSGTNLFSVLGSYRFDSIKRTWKVVELNKYFVGYDFDKHAVPFAYIHKSYFDTTKNTRSMTTFSFKAKNLPDTQFFYDIVGKDTIFVAKHTFNHDTADRLVHLNRKHASGSVIETYFEYTDSNRIATELNLSIKSQFATIDSVSRYTYLYDSTGLLTSLQEEKYGLPGRENAWTVTEQQTFAWNNKGMLVGDRVYLADTAYQLELDHLHLYSYNVQDQIETYIHMRYRNGEYVDRHKLVIFYDGNSAKYGYEYPWEDTDYSHRASRYYVFGTEDITEIKDVTKSTELRLYPNPATQAITLPEELANIPVNIFAMDGRLLIKTSASAGADIDVSTLVAGTYLLQAGNYLPTMFVKA
jgi:hypothetical protein